MRIGVIGGGLMGSGIAEVCARAGVDVTVVEADAALRGLVLGHGRRIVAVAHVLRERSLVSLRIDEDDVVHGLAHLGLTCGHDGSWTIPL